MSSGAPIMKDHKQIRPSELPFQIISDIMLNLPLKSLLRFKIVSKQWLNQITSRDFARAQVLLNHQKKVSSVIFITPIIFNYDIAELLYIDKNVLVETESEGGLPLRPFKWRLPVDRGKCGGNLSLVSPCNGVLCARLSDKSRVLLWNPVTNYYKIVLVISSERRRYIIGFGYNPSDNDYKLVSIADGILQIMSLKSNSCKRGRIENELTVICLDLNEAKLRKIHMPRPSGKFAMTCFWGLTTFRGMLCLILARRKSERSGALGGCEIWVMKEENNWIKLCDIAETLGFPLCCKHEDALFMSRDVLFIRDNQKCTSKVLMMHDLKLHYLTNIGFVGSLVEPLVFDKPPVMQSYSRKKKRKLP